MTEPAARIGRPPKLQPRTHIVTARLSDGEHAACQRAAALAEMQLGPWMRLLIVSAARRAK